MKPFQPEFAMTPLDELKAQYEVKSTNPLEAILITQLFKEAIDKAYALGQDDVFDRYAELFTNPPINKQERAVKQKIEMIKERLERRYNIGSESGDEPSLWEMAVHYYKSHGIEPDRAVTFASILCARTAAAIENP